MANISLILGAHQDMTPIKEVKIEWTNTISIKRLKEFLAGQGHLRPDEIAIWNAVKDESEWLYCFAGHIDTRQEIENCYIDDSKKKEAQNSSDFQRCLHSNEMQAGNDVRLDIGMVVDQTIETRIKQHFADDSYLEAYRRDATICFQKKIDPYVNQFTGDFIDALETILIMGNKGTTRDRLGVCNGNKTENPQLNYPIQNVTNSYTFGCIEKNINVEIKDE